MALAGLLNFQLVLQLFNLLGELFVLLTLLHDLFLLFFSGKFLLVELTPDLLSEINVGDSLLHHEVDGFDGLVDVVGAVLK